MTLTARQFSRFGAANVATSGRLIVTGHIANALALLANAEWDLENFKAVTDSKFCDDMRADIRAVKDCKATASEYVKTAVSLVKPASVFFAGVISRRDTYATEADMVKAAFVQADAAGATTGASLKRLLAGKAPHEVKEEKPTVSTEQRLENEATALDSARVAAPISMAALFDTAINTVVTDTAPAAPPVLSPVVTQEESARRWIADSDSVEALSAMAALITARVASLLASGEAAIVKAEKQAKGG